MRGFLFHIIIRKTNCVLRLEISCMKQLFLRENSKSCVPTQCVFLMEICVERKHTRLPCMCFGGRGRRGDLGMYAASVVRRERNSVKQFGYRECYTFYGSTRDW